MPDTPTPDTPTTGSGDPGTGDPAIRTERCLALNEDWAATVAGLVLLVLVLVGAIPGWIVP